MKFVQCSSRKYPHSPTEGIGNSCRVGRGGKLIISFLLLDQPPPNTKHPPPPHLPCSCWCKYCRYMHHCTTCTLYTVAKSDTSKLAILSEVFMYSCFNPIQTGLFFFSFFLSFLLFLFFFFRIYSKKFKFRIKG